MVLFNMSLIKICTLPLRFAVRCLFFIEGAEWSEMSAPVKPSPDFGNERNQRENIFGFECPLGCLVPELNHAKQSTGPAAERPQHHKDGFGYAPARTLRTPFVESEHEKCRRIECGEPDGGK